MIANLPGLETHFPSGAARMMDLARHPEARHGVKTADIPTVGTAGVDPTHAEFPGGAEHMRRHHPYLPLSQRAPRPVPAGQRTLPVLGDVPDPPGRHLRGSQPCSPLVAALAGDVPTFTASTVATHRAFAHMVTKGGTDMRPLLTEALADAALDAKCALEDGQARIVRAVADRELSVTTGREIMATLLRLVELNDEIHRQANAVHMAQRIADIGFRGGFVEPSPKIRRRLAEGGLAVIGCENVSELHPDEDQVA